MPKERNRLHAEVYEKYHCPMGVTVAEYEAKRGLPRYTVYPEAKLATRATDKGYYMYHNEPNKKMKGRM